MVDKRDRRCRDRFLGRFRVQYKVDDFACSRLCFCPKIQELVEHMKIILNGPGKVKFTVGSSGYLA